MIPLEPGPHTIPYLPMMRPPDHLEPNIDQADSLPPTAVPRKHLEAALACMMRRAGVSVVDVPTGALLRQNVYSATNGPGILRVHLES